MTPGFRGKAVAGRWARSEGRGACWGARVGYATGRLCWKSTLQLRGSGLLWVTAFFLELHLLLLSQVELED